MGDLVRLTKADVINGAIEYIASKTIEENQKTILVPLNKTALAILEKYKDYEGPKLLPFITQPGTDSKQILPALLSIRKTLLRAASSRWPGR